MDTIKKLLGALNIFQKIEDVLISKVIAKGVKAGIQALLGMAVMGKVIPGAADAGVTIDFTKLETYLIAIGTGLVASLWNWVKKRYDFQK